MKKLRLEVESLAVDSFPIDRTADDPGTVRAHQGTFDTFPFCPTSVCNTTDRTACGLTRRDC